MTLALVPALMLLQPVQARPLAFQSLEPVASSAAFASRDGKAEAIAELAAGGPARLYSHVSNGRAPGFSTPGLRFCGPNYAATPKGRSLFRPLHEADWQEPEPFPPQFEAAVRFARAYNLTMFKRRKAQIVRVCRRVRLER